MIGVQPGEGSIRDYVGLCACAVFYFILLFSVFGRILNLDGNLRRVIIHSYHGGSDAFVLL